MSSIGSRLKEERKRLRISQDDFSGFALAAGVPGATRQSQAKYEKGTQIPSAAYMEAIAVSGADVLYIITGQRSAAPTLTPEEAAFLDNYRHSPLEKQRTLQQVCAALAQQGPARVAK